MLGASPAPSSPPSLPSPLENRWRQDFNRRVEALAQTADPAIAASILAQRIPADPGRHYLYASQFAAAATEQEDALTNGASAERIPANVASSLQTLLADQAEQLAAAGRAALAANDGCAAAQWFHQVLYFQPDHAEARRFLGLSATNAPRAPQPDATRTPRRAHPRYGWPAGSYTVTTTEHFVITSNADANRIALLTTNLEMVHAAWEQLFLNPANQLNLLRLRAAGRQHRPSSRRRHQVVLCRTRDDYLKILQPLEPRAEVTRGYYHADSQTAYFIGDADSKPATWRHEATHQLFAEKVATTQRVGARQNVWVVEGIALYMESLHLSQRWLAVGGIDTERLQFARYRRRRADAHMPTADLVLLDQSTLQSHPEIRGLYSQAAGFTQFLLHAEQGKWRRATLDYLAEVYAGRDQADSLPRLTHCSTIELDAAYEAFLNVTDEDLQQLDPHAIVTQLCLGNTAVTDTGLQQLPSLEQAEWIDLFGTHVSDAGTERLGQAPRLQQLSLERTRIGDATVARLATAENLRQLDLSQTAVTDRGLAHLANLTALEALWLTSTQVTDAGLTALHGLRKLKTLDVTETQVTSAGLAELQRVLPGVAAP